MTLPEPVRFGDLCVLHVDDEQTQLELGAEFLRRELSDTICLQSTTDIKEATEIVASEPIGCVISDYDMPKMSGLEFLEHVREKDPELPFILYTGKGSEEIAGRAINAGVTGYLQKGGAEQYRRLANRVDHALREYWSHIQSTRRSTVLEALGYPVYVVDKDGAFTYINDAFVELVGYDRERLIGAEPSLIKTEESTARINESLRTIVSSSGPEIKHLEVGITTADGEVIPCKDHLTALPFEDEFQGCAGILRDISDRREQEQALREKNERLENLVSVLSHDLQTPLATAQGAADLARKTGEDAHFEMLEQSHHRLEDMLDELLVMAREGERATAPDAVALARAADRAWETVETKDATLKVNNDLVIEADPERLRRLFENLYANAIKHAGANATVTVGSLSDDQGRDIGFFVSDDGPGIEPDNRETVLEPGFTTSDEGTGFGLAIVSRIANAHDWELTISESDAGGAQFQITNVSTLDAAHLQEPTHSA